MAPGTRLLDDVLVTFPERCDICSPELGSVPDNIEALVCIGRWRNLAHRCSFCGGPIKLIAGTLEHIHEGKDKGTWAIQNPEWEEHAWWSEHGPFGNVEIRAHVACVKAGMPFANFEKRDYRDTEIPPKVDGIEVVIEEPCDVCGSMSNEQDIQRVIGRLYDVSHAHACDFCGDPVKLRKIVIWHKDLCEKHSPYPSRWHFHKWEWEPMFRWTWHTMSPAGVLDFVGHLACARDKMRYAEWDGPTMKNKRWTP